MMDFDRRMKIVTFAVTGAATVMLITANYGDQPNIGNDAQKLLKSAWKWMWKPSENDIEEIRRRQERR